MIKQFVIVITIAYAAHLYFQQATNTLVNTTVLLPSEPHPELNWYLTSGSAVTSTNAPATTPLVTIENILPSKLLSAALSEIQSSITTTTITPNKDSPYLKQSCTLARDGGACGDERWIDFTHEDALRYHDDFKQQNTNTSEKPLIEKDLMEQVILHISKYDLVHVLPHYVSKHVKGVSWRILISTTGHNHQKFHYDSDEGTNYAMKDVPLITPVLSTVTYLSDSGEPTLILDTSQLTNDTIYHPTNAYVSMPKKNKHLAFDSRLFHGSSGPLFVGKEGDVRIAIGTNFHTQRSLETIYSKRHRLMKQYVHRPLEVRSEEATPPIDMRECVAEREDEPVIKPWNTDDNVGDPLRENWTSFQIKTNHQGRSFFASDRYKKSNITMQLPIDWILEQARHDMGCTLSITLERSDFNVSHHRDENYRPKPKIRNKEAKLVAREMLLKRCQIYPDGLLSMNPPLNVNVCPGQLLGSNR
eukprot:scaffold6301_cov157-Skeletonema_marinoi.AAC.2